MRPRSLRRPTTSSAPRKRERSPQAGRGASCTSRGPRSTYRKAARPTPTKPTRKARAASSGSLPSACSFVTANRPYYLYRMVMGGHTQTGVAFVGFRARLRAEPHPPPRAHAARQRKRSRTQHRDVERADGTRPARLSRERRPARSARRRDERGTAVLGDGAERRGAYGLGHHARDRCDAGSSSSTRSKRCISPTAIIARPPRPASPRQRRGSPDASHEFFLAVAFPHDEMRILDYNRVVRDLNGLSPDALLARVRESFSVEPLHGGEIAGGAGDVRDVSRRRLVRAQDPLRSRAAPRSRRKPRREPAAGPSARADLGDRRSAHRRAHRLRRRSARVSPSSSGACSRAARPSRSRCIRRAWSS